MSYYQGQSSKLPMPNYQNSPAQSQPPYYQDSHHQPQMPYSQYQTQTPYHLAPPSQSQSSMYYQGGPSQATLPPYTSQTNLPGNAAAPEELAKYSNQDAEALFSGFREPPSGRVQPLALPLCLPQATSGANALFVRAYSQELRSSGIEVDDWMRFIDGLNLAMTASPPLRVVDVAGLVIGFVPHHWAIIAGAAMQTVAQTGIHILAKTLSDRLLRRANAEYFAPRGMRVRICKTAAMRRVLGLDATRVGDASGSEKLVKFGKAAGRTAETVALHLPVIRKVYNRIAPPVPTVDPNAPGEMAARRMLDLQGYALPLSFDVPPAEPVQGIMDKASGLSVRMQSWRLRQKEADTNHKRQLLAFSEGRATSLPSTPSSSSSGDRNPLEVAMDWRKERKWSKQERRALSGRSSKKLRTNVEIADRLEYNSTDGLLWIVLVNADRDAEIQGTELVDNAEDVETVRDADWQREMRREAEEDQYMMDEQHKFGKAA